MIGNFLKKKIVSLVTCMSFLERLEGVQYLGFGGCGTKASAYLGVLDVLQHWCGYDRLHRRLKGCIGTSSGSLTAMGVMLGVPARKLLDAGRDAVNDICDLTPNVDVAQLIQKYGLDSGDAVRRIIQCSMRAMGVEETITFEALHRMTGKELAICATRMRSSSSEVFTHLTHPTVRVADAMYASMTVPFVFVPISINGELYGDGGLTYNTPFHYFPGNDTIIFRMPDLCNTPIDGIRSFAMATAMCIVTAQEVACSQHSQVYPGRLVNVLNKEQLGSAAISLTNDDEMVQRWFRAGAARCRSLLWPEVAEHVGAITEAIAGVALRVTAYSLTCASSTTRPPSHGEVLPASGQ